jgi:hypothetical protein
VRDQVSHTYKTTGKTTVLYTLILVKVLHYGVRSPDRLWNAPNLQ